MVFGVSGPDDPLDAMAMIIALAKTTPTAAQNQAF
jgi:hypothetical protein